MMDISTEDFLFRNFTHNANHIQNLKELNSKKVVEIHMYYSELS